MTEYSDKTKDADKTININKIFKQNNKHSRNTPKQNDKQRPLRQNNKFRQNTGTQIDFSDKTIKTDKNIHTLLLNISLRKQEFILSCLFLPVNSRESA